MTVNITGEFSDESDRALPECVLHLLNSNETCLLQRAVEKQAVQVSGGVVFHRPVWYACVSQPTPIHLMGAWLAFLPHSVIMALLQDSLLGFLWRRRHVLTETSLHFSPGHSAQTLILNNKSSTGKNVF